MINQDNKKPDWLRKRTSYTQKFINLTNYLAQHNLHTVCQEADCPNMSECFNKDRATFLIMGPHCTRSCSFCSVTKADTLPLDPNEIKNIIKTIKYLKLKYAVITSVTRDDLSDGGADFFVKTVTEIKKKFPEINIEILVPDFKGDLEQISRILKTGITVFNHNLETIPRFYSAIRPQADYQRSLKILEFAAANSDKIVKTGIMLGMGETKEEVREIIKDIYNTGCQVITIGQYLQPSKRHVPVVRYIPPAQFNEYKQYGETLGISKIYAGPFVRSSYNAAEIFNKKT